MLAKKCHHRKQLQNEFTAGAVWKISCMFCSLSSRCIELVVGVFQIKAVVVILVNNLLVVRAVKFVFGSMGCRTVSLCCINTAMICPFPSMIAFNNY